MHFLKNAAFVGVFAAASIGVAHADIITFDSQGLTGPSYAYQTSASTIAVPTSVGAVTFSGGAILTNESFLPANPTSVYYSSYFLTGGLDLVTVTFPTEVTNFSMDVYNGETYAETFTAADDLGASSTVSVAGNSADGYTLVSLPGAVTSVTIGTPDTAWFDFSIDNIAFEASAGGGGGPVPAPEPGSLALLGTAVAALGIGLGRRVRSRA